MRRKESIAEQAYPVGFMQSFATCSGVCIESFFKEIPFFWSVTQIKAFKLWQLDSLTSIH